LLGQRIPAPAGFELGENFLRFCRVGDEDVARAYLCRLVEQRAVLVEVRLDVAVRDVNLRCDAAA